jgi:ParB-like chromosome segregation protein Spo0J
MEPVQIDVSSIVVLDRLRPIDPKAVGLLVESMRRLGQLQPIAVYCRDGSEELVSGAHRLEAAKLLGWEHIYAIRVDSDRDRDDLEMIEIAENLHRSDLTTLERSNQIARWAELTAAKARQVDEPLPGGKQPGEKGQAKAARELGISEPDVRRAVKVASISPEAQRAARDAGLDNNRSVLLAVAKESTPEAQVRQVGVEAAERALRRGGSSSPRNSPHCEPPSKAGAAWTHLYGIARAFAEWATPENIALAKTGFNERTDSQAADLRVVSACADTMSKLAGSLSEPAAHRCSRSTSTISKATSSARRSGTSNAGSKHFPTRKKPRNASGTTNGTL